MSPQQTYQSFFKRLSNMAGVDVVLFVQPQPDIMETSYMLRMGDKIRVFPVEETRIEGFNIFKQAEDECRKYGEETKTLDGNVKWG